MKRVLISLLLFLMMAPHYYATTMATNLDPIISVQRNIEILNSGITLMNDVITLETSETTSFSLNDFTIGLHKFFVEETQNFEIWEDNRWKTVEVETEDLSDERFKGYKLIFASPITIMQGTSLKIRASFVFISLVSTRFTEFVAQIPVFPAIQYNISSYSLMMTMPPGAELTNVTSLNNYIDNFNNDTWTVEYYNENIEPLSYLNSTISYEPHKEDEYLIECDNLERHLIIDQGKIKAEDSYLLINRGNKFKRFTIEIPLKASNIKAMDSIGPLKLTYDSEEADGYVDILITPRFDVNNGDKWGFTLSYQLPKKEYVEKEGKNSILKYPIYGFPYFIRKLSSRVTIQEGGRFVSSEPEPTSIQKVGLNPEIIINFGITLPNEKPEMLVKFVSTVIWTYIRPVGLILIIAGVFTAVLIIKKREEVITVKPITLPETPNLNKFFDLYSERITLYSELTELEEALETNNIEKTYFDQRSAEINKRLLDLSNMLKKLEKTVETEEPSIILQLKEIRRAENSLERVEKDIKNLDIRLRARRVTRRDYQRRKEEYKRRKKQFIKQIEKLIASFGKNT